MSEGEKEGPARQQEDCLPPSCGYPAGPTGQGEMRGLSSYQPY